MQFSCSVKLWLTPGVSNTGGDDEEGDDLEMSFDENEDDRVVEDYWGYWPMKED